MLCRVAEDVLWMSRYVERSLAVVGIDRVDPLHVHEAKVRRIALRPTSGHDPMEVPVGERLVSRAGSEPTIPSEDPPQHRGRQLGEIPRGSGRGGAWRRNISRARGLLRLPWPGRPR